MASKFQQRHFEAIAEVIQEVRQMAELRSGGNQQKLDGFLLGISSIEGELVGMFRSDNPMFDTNRFHRACQVGANVKARV